MKYFKVKKHQRLLSQTKGSYKFLEERDLLHPKNLLKIPGAPERYGKCLEKAKEWARLNDAVVYSRGNHAIAIKNGLVYDYVLSPDKLIPERTYFENVDGVFERV